MLKRFAYVLVARKPSGLAGGGGGNLMVSLSPSSLFPNPKLNRIHLHVLWRALFFPTLPLLSMLLLRLIFHLIPVRLHESYPNTKTTTPGTLTDWVSE